MIFNGQRMLENRDALAIMIRTRELLQRKDVAKIEIEKGVEI